MIADALALWPILSLLAGWLAGRFIRVGAVDSAQGPAPVCNQNCRQGRDCRCGLANAGETPP